jgi:rare lipoprotein A
VLASLAAATGALMGPGLAFAGAGSGSGGAGTGPGSSSSPPVTPVNVPVSASNGGVTIQTEASAFLRGGVSVSGTAPAGDAGDTIEIDQLSAAPGAAWTKATVATVQSGGSFTAAWHPSQTGQFTIRAEIQSEQASQANTTAPAVTVTVYRRSLATLYGPGFYGQRTACGQVLRRKTIGVANRTLPCGTEVSIEFRGRAITVPVIDRGPYAHNASWDITMATARALGMPGTETIGAAATAARVQRAQRARRARRARRAARRRPRPRNRAGRAQLTSVGPGAGGSVPPSSGRSVTIPIPLASAANLVCSAASISPAAL